MNGTNGMNGIPAIKTTIGTKSWRARRATTRFVGESSRSALALTVACGAGLLLASQLRSGTPWAGLNALARASGTKVRRRKRFDAQGTLTGVGVLAAGLAIVATLYQGARLAAR